MTKKAKNDSRSLSKYLVRSEENTRTYAHGISAMLPSVVRISILNFDHIPGISSCKPRAKLFSGGLSCFVFVRLVIDQDRVKISCAKCVKLRAASPVNRYGGDLACPARTDHIQY